MYENHIGDPLRQIIYIYIMQKMILKKLTSFEERKRDELSTKLSQFKKDKRRQKASTSRDPFLESSMGNCLKKLNE